MNDTTQHAITVTQCSPKSAQTRLCVQQTSRANSDKTQKSSFLVFWEVNPLVVGFSSAQKSRDVKDISIRHHAHRVSYITYLLHSTDGRSTYFVRPLTIGLFPISAQIFVSWNQFIANIYSITSWAKSVLALTYQNTIICNLGVSGFPASKQRIETYTANSEQQYGVKTNTSWITICQW